MKKEELRRIERENMKIARKIIEMKPGFKVDEMLNEWNQTKSISLGLRRIKKKKIPITDGKMGLLPPLSTSNSLEQLPQSQSSNKKVQ